MAFSVAKSRPFRSLGLYKASGKHAAPKGNTPSAERQAEQRHTGPRQSGRGQSGRAEQHSHRPAHAATMPRLTGPNKTNATDKKAA
jgi:hypothetical protein